MGSANSSFKGAQWERAVCQHLSYWVSGGTRDDLYWRSAMSGGRATVGKKTGKARRFKQVLDITAVDREGAPLLDLFAVECKWYKDLQLHLWVWGGIGLSNEIWYEPLRQARDKEVELLVVAKQNRKPPVVLLQARALDMLRRGECNGKTLKPLAQFRNPACFVILWKDVLQLDPQKVISGGKVPLHERHTLNRPTSRRVPLERVRLARSAS